MMNTNCTITRPDRRRLGNLLTNREGRAWGRQRWRAALETVLEEGTAIDPNVAPATLVTMNSTVELIDLETGNRRVVSLAYPQDVDLVSDGLSVVDPLGVALIGSQVGDVVQCPAEQCAKRMRVARIVYQPEHHGHRHL